jgi:UDP-2,4-diacetamido-2,4,6-trideoxy-beta-L-altropyranose hydrolase
VKSRNNLFIRADSLTSIGTGHIMRCLALAQAWQDWGGKATFISKCESHYLRQKLINERMDFIAIEKSHPDPNDLASIMKILHEISKKETKNTSWVVIDGYHFDSDYQKNLKKAGYNILWIDDYGHSAQYWADLILNQNISADELLYRNRKPYTKLLLGTRYTLLRREFKEWQGWKRKIPDIAHKVLVTLGGSDPFNVTLKVIQALKKVDVPELKAIIVVGAANSNLTSLELAVADHSNFQLVINPSNMPGLMAWADIAVSAGGSTCWEMALLGLPNVIIHYAENQRPISEKLHEKGAALSLGWNHVLPVACIAQNIERILIDSELRRTLSTNSRRLVDGSGSKRVCNEIV